MSDNLNNIYKAIKNDNNNQKFTKIGYEPIYSVSSNSKIIIIGQAPGIKAQQSQIAWNDKSGDTLRSWLGVSKEQFYDTNLFAIIPMDFYYPGKAKNGDLPPRKDFAEKWHPKIFNELKNIKLIILIGNYALKHYLKERYLTNLTETVKNYQSFLPKFFVLPHSSPLNFRWQNNNPWFEKEVLPNLKKIINSIINQKKEFFQLQNS